MATTVNERDICVVVILKCNLAFALKPLDVVDLVIIEATSNILNKSFSLQAKLQSHSESYKCLVTFQENVKREWEHLDHIWSYGNTPVIRPLLTRYGRPFYRAFLALRLVKLPKLLSGQNFFYFSPASWLEWLQITYENISTIDGTRSHSPQLFQLMTFLIFFFSLVLLGLASSS
jgi:hypothetical protein